jgi:hypothetical protein
LKNIRTWTDKLNIIIKFINIIKIKIIIIFIIIINLGQAYLPDPRKLELEKAPHLTCLGVAKARTQITWGL